MSKGCKTQSIAVIQANPEQSKHLETATVKILGFDVDFVNLRAETYAGYVHVSSFWRHFLLKMFIFLRREFSDTRDANRYAYGRCSSEVRNKLLNLSWTVNFRYADLYHVVETLQSMLSSTISTNRPWKTSPGRDWAIWALVKWEMTSKRLHFSCTASLVYFLVIISIMTIPGLIRTPISAHITFLDDPLRVMPFEPINALLTAYDSPSCLWVGIAGDSF